MTMALAMWGWSGAWATDYTDITANYGVYSLSDQTDTWTRCNLTVTNLYVASNVNSVAELRLISTTNNIKSTHYVGYAGRGVLRAENNSLLQFDSATMYVGRLTNNGAFYMTDSTGVVAAGKSALLHLGQAVSSCNTGSLYLLRSKLYPASGGTLTIYAGGDGSPGGVGRIFATNSTLVANGGIAIRYCGDDSLSPNGYFLFDNSTVTLGACYLSGWSDWGAGRGYMLLTNNCEATISGILSVGHFSGNSYECTVTVSGSRLTVGGNVDVGWRDYGTVGRGRLTLKDGAVGQFSGNVVLGKAYDFTYHQGYGYLDVLSSSRLSITNAATNATLTVGETGGHGWLTVTGGSTCRVDRLVVTTNAYGSIAFSNGMLSVKSGTISNGLTTIIGDGTNSATLDLWGRRPFNVTSNLVFTNGATLKVEVGGAATNDCNFLNVHGILTFHPMTALVITLTNGYTPPPGTYITVAIADTLSTKPSIVSQGYSAYIVDEGSRKALKIFRIPAGAIVKFR